MAAPEPRRVLIVANRTEATPDLLETVRRYAREEPTTFALLIPDVPSNYPDWTMDLALPLLQQAAGAPVKGLAGGGGDPFEAVDRALFGSGYDSVIISTLPRPFSRWLRRDLPRRVEGLGVAVEVVTSGRGRSVVSP
jgi:hypothetical protein